MILFLMVSKTTFVHVGNFLRDVKYIKIVESISPEQRRTQTQGLPTGPTPRQPRPRPHWALPHGSLYGLSAHLLALVGHSLKAATSERHGVPLKACKHKFRQT